MLFELAVLSIVAGQSPAPFVTNAWEQSLSANSPAGNFLATAPAKPQSETPPACAVCQQSPDGFLHRFLGAYREEFFPEKRPENEKPDDVPAPRRALPAPFASPPFPSGEWQGFPLIGVPPSDAVYPFMKAVYGSPWGDEIKESRIKFYGWLNASGNWSTANDSNTPAAYWINPNRLALDQALIRLEREVDSVQADRVDIGFRISGFYGTNYRNTVAGGWGIDQIQVHNLLYGFDPVENFANVYLPGVADGLIITIGRWSATPDVEDAFPPDNYQGTHSLTYTYDTTTQTGVMATVMLDKQWTVQAAIHAGPDMAPWYAGAVPTGMFGMRWVSRDNQDSVYTVLNNISNAEFQYFDVRGVPAGHHNYNCVESTWQHKFSDACHTKTQGIVMWERNAPVGGTPSIGPFQFNTGGGLGPTVPGLSLTTALLNYTVFKLSDKDFVTFRNEWTKDENGTRYGYAGNYTSNSIGWSHNLGPSFQVRPEIGYYRNWNNPAFDNGASKNLVLYGLDATLRF